MLGTIVLDRCFNAVDVSDRAASKFADGGVEANMLLVDLKRRVRARAEEVHTFHGVPWRAGGLDPLKYPEHLAYCKASIDRLVDSVARSVFRAVAERGACAPTATGATAEALQHAHTMHSTLSRAHFAEEAHVTPALVEVVARLRGDAVSSAGVVLCGASGVGKTVAAAWAARELLAGAPKGTVFVLRFCGSTSAARDELCSPLMRTRVCTN